jgi:hypothetical protein
MILRRTFPALLALLLAPAMGLRADPRLSAFAEGGTASLLTEGGKTYVVHEFTTVGTSTFTVKRSGGLEVEYLIVAGGGASGSGAQNGQNSSAFSQVALGGGRGKVRSGIGDAGNNGGDGGSGGGASGEDGGPYPGGSGTVGQGHDGGRGQGTQGGSDNRSGGGGGAGGPGTDGFVSGGIGTGGDGGPGVANLISGAEVFYAGGGVGTGHISGGGAAGEPGIGGGGGKGQNGENGRGGGAGGTAPYEGGGGAGGLLSNVGGLALSIGAGTHSIQVGAGGSGGRSGGSGIVIVRYELVTSLELTGSPTIMVGAPDLAGAPPATTVVSDNARLRWVSLGTNKIEVRPDAPSAIPQGVKLFVQLGSGAPVEIPAGGGWATLLAATTDTAGDETLTYSVTFDPVSDVVATAPVVVDLDYRIGP